MNLLPEKWLKEACKPCAWRQRPLSRHNLILLFIFWFSFNLYFMLRIGTRECYVGIQFYFSLFITLISRHSCIFHLWPWQCWWQEQWGQVWGTVPTAFWLSGIKPNSSSWTRTSEENYKTRAFSAGSPHSWTHPPCFIQDRGTKSVVQGNKSK